MVGLKLHYHIFPNSQKDWKVGFLNLALAGLLQFIKEMENWNFEN